MENHRPEMPSIESMEASTKQHIKTHYFWQIACLVLLFLVIETVIIYQAFFLMKIHPGWMVMPVIGLVFAYAEVRTKNFQTLFDDFAVKEGYTYQSQATYEGYKGSQYLFMMGLWSKIEDVLSGSHAGRPFRLYTYSTRPLAIGHRYRQGYTVFETEHNRNIEGVIVDANIHPFSTVLFGSRFPDKKKIKLDGIGRHTNVYVPEKYVGDIRMIFTPDILKMIADQERRYSFEFLGNKLYVIAGRTIQEKADLERMYDFAAWLVSALAPKLENVRSGSGAK